jgi:hypothetical protein
MWLGYDMDPDCVYEVANGNYTMSGPIQKLAPVGTDYQISAGTEYELFILPVEEGKTEYAIEDVYVFNFSSVALVAGGTGSASVAIEPDFTMATATITVTGAAMAYYNWYEKANVPSDVTAALLNEYFAVNQFPAKVVNSSLTANTEYVLAVLTVSADGKYSEAQTFEFKTSSIDFSQTFTLTATKQEMADPIAAATGVSVKLETAGGTVKNFRYINKPTSQFNSAYPDEMTLAKKMSKGNGTKSGEKKPKKKKAKNPEMNSGVMNMIGNFTVLRFTGMLGMRNVTFTKEELLKMNAQLNRIKKPRGTK